MINEAHLDKETGKPILPHDYFVFVKGGTFMMGGEEYGDGTPIHQVKVGDFYIARFLLTQVIYKEIIGNNPSNFEWFELSERERPVEKVSWLGAQEFCKQLSSKTGHQYRLPTEAEWEYAAQDGNKAGNKKMIYAGSNNLNNVGWYEKNSKGKTQPVGLKDPNLLGIYDMSGNVWEWCNSLYKPYPYDANDGREIMDDIGDFRAFRGGSERSDATLCRLAYRGFNASVYNAYDLGFRLAFTPVKG